MRLLRLLSQLGMTLYMIYHVLVLLVEGWCMVVEGGGFLTCILDINGKCNRWTCISSLQISITHLPIILS